MLNCFGLTWTTLSETRHFFKYKSMLKEALKARNSFGQIFLYYLENAIYINQKGLGKKTRINNLKCNLDIILRH